MPLDILGMLLLLIGAWLLNRQSNIGWLVIIVGIICFLIVGFTNSLYGIVVFGIIYILFALFNYLRGGVWKW